MNAQSQSNSTAGQAGLGSPTPASPGLGGANQQTLANSASVGSTLGLGGAVPPPPAGKLQSHSLFGTIGGGLLGGVAGFFGGGTLGAISGASGGAKLGDALTGGGVFTPSANNPAQSQQIAQNTQDRLSGIYGGALPVPQQYQPLQQQLYNTVSGDLSGGSQLLAVQQQQLNAANQARISAAGAQFGGLSPQAMMNFTLQSNQQAGEQSALLAAQEAQRAQRMGLDLQQQAINPYIQGQQIASGQAGTQAAAAYNQWLQQQGSQAGQTAALSGSLDAFTKWLQDQQSGVSTDGKTPDQIMASINNGTMKIPSPGSPATALFGGAPGGIGQPFGADPFAQQGLGFAQQLHMNRARGY